MWTGITRCNHGKDRGLDPHGEHDKYVVEFVQKYRDTLEQLPSAFFSVSLCRAR
jgi:hypothetical protein